MMVIMIIFHTMEEKTMRYKRQFSKSVVYFVIKYSHLCRLDLEFLSFSHSEFQIDCFAALCYNIHAY
jgi:hypothetical protein